MRLKAAVGLATAACVIALISLFGGVISQAQLTAPPALMYGVDTGTGLLHPLKLASDGGLTVTGGGGGVQYDEDNPHTSGDTGTVALVRRIDTAASSSGTSGDYSTLNVDALGKLWISGAYAEDSASANADLGLMVLTRRTDAVAATAGTDGDYQPFITDASGRLWVNCSTGCSGGTQYTEDAASAGGETLTLAGAVRQNTLASSTSADGDYAYLKVDTLGSMYVNPFGATQAAATYLTVRLSDGTSFLTPSSDQTEDAAVAGGETGPMVLTRRIDTASSSAGTSGDFAMLNTNNVGALWVSQVDPCSSEAKITAAFSLTARGIIIAATSSKKNYICAISVVAGAAEIFNIDEGTGTTCQTGTAAVVGSTTAANGMSFAANGGLAAIGGNSTVIAGLTANVDTCIVPSSSNRLAGFVTYVQR